MWARERYSESSHCWRREPHTKNERKSRWPVWIPYFLGNSRCTAPFPWGEEIASPSVQVRFGWRGTTSPLQGEWGPHGGEAHPSSGWEHPKFHPSILKLHPVGSYHHKTNPERINVTKFSLQIALQKPTVAHRAVLLFGGRRPNRYRAVPANLDGRAQNWWRCHQSVTTNRAYCVHVRHQPLANRCTQTRVRLYILYFI